MQQSLADSISWERGALYIYRLTEGQCRKSSNLHSSQALYLKTHTARILFKAPYYGNLTEYYRSLLWQLKLNCLQEVFLPELSDAREDPPEQAGKRSSNPFFVSGGFMKSL